MASSRTGNTVGRYWSLKSMVDENPRMNFENFFRKTFNVSPTEWHHISTAMQQHRAEFIRKSGLNAFNLFIKMGTNVNMPGNKVRNHDILRTFGFESLHDELNIDFVSIHVAHDFYPTAEQRARTEIIVPNVKSYLGERLFSSRPKYDSRMFQVMGLPVRGHSSHRQSSTDSMYYHIFLNQKNSNLDYDHDIVDHFETVKYPNTVGDHYCRPIIINKMESDDTLEQDKLLSVKFTQSYLKTTHYLPFHAKPHVFKPASLLYMQGVDDIKAKQFFNDMSNWFNIIDMIQGGYVGARMEWVFDLNFKDMKVKYPHLQRDEQTQQFTYENHLENQELIDNFECMDYFLNFVTYASYGSEIFELGENEERIVSDASEYGHSIYTEAESLMSLSQTYASVINEHVCLAYFMMTCPLIETWSDSDLQDVLFPQSFIPLMTVVAGESIAVYVFDGELYRQKDYNLLKSVLGVNLNDGLQTPFLERNPPTGSNDQVCGGHVSWYPRVQRNVINRLPGQYVPWGLDYRSPYAYQRYYIMHKLYIIEDRDFNINSFLTTRLYLGSCIVALRKSRPPIIREGRSRLTNRPNEWGYLTKTYIRNRIGVGDAQIKQSITCEEIALWFSDSNLMNAVEIIGRYFQTRDQNRRIQQGLQGPVASVKHYTDVVKTTIRQSLTGECSVAFREGRLQLFFNTQSRFRGLRDWDALRYHRNIVRFMSRDFALIIQSAENLFGIMDGPRFARSKYSLNEILSEQIIRGVINMGITNFGLKNHAGNQPNVHQTLYEGNMPFIMQNFPMAQIIMRMWYCPATMNDPHFQSLQDYRCWQKHTALAVIFYLTNLRYQDGTNRAFVFYEMRARNKLLEDSTICRTIKRVFVACGLATLDNNRVTFYGDNNFRVDAYKIFPHWWGLHRVAPAVYGGRDAALGQHVRFKFTPSDHQHYPQPGGILDQTIKYMPPGLVFFFWPAMKSILQNSDDVTTIGRENMFPRVMVVEQYHMEQIWSRRRSRAGTAQPKFYPVYADPDKDSVVNKALWNYSPNLPVTYPELLKVTDNVLNGFIREDFRLGYEDITDTQGI